MKIADSVNPRPMVYESPDWLRSCLEISCICRPKDGSVPRPIEMMARYANPTLA